MSELEKNALQQVMKTQAEALAMEKAGENTGENAREVADSTRKIYQAIEKGVVGGYKAIENGVVGG